MPGPGGVVSYFGSFLLPLDAQIEHKTWLGPIKPDNMTAQVMVLCTSAPDWRHANPSAHAYNHATYL